MTSYFTIKNLPVLPILIQTNSLTLYSYPLFIGFAWGVGYQFMLYLFECYSKTEKHLRLMFLGVFISSWIGAKLFFLLFSAPEKMSLFVSKSSFWLGGGFIFYGGLVFALLFLSFWCFSLKLLRPSDLSLLLPPLGLAHAIGRVGCFLAGCCYGSVCDLPWAIHLHAEKRHPVQLYESFLLLLLSLVTYKQIKRQVSPANIVLTYVASYSALRFILEFYRADAIRGSYANLSTSQWISIVLLVVILFAISWEIYKGKKA